MKRILFSKNQIEEVAKNENVSRFCGKYITYSRTFKIRAASQYINEGLSSSEIFKRAGFDLSVIGRSKPKTLMFDWVKIYREKGAEGFAEDNRGKYGGRYKKLKETITDEEKIKRLELEIRYLKKENLFLAKLRAKRSE